MDFWYSTARNIVRAYVALFIHKIHVSGYENIPPGPKIIVGNHSNATDSFVLPIIFQEQLHFAIQSELFSIPWIGRLLSLADQVPVYFGRGRDALRMAKERLEKGHSVVIYPEGRLDFGQELHRGGIGAAILAMQTGLPVVPLGFYVPPQFVRVVHSKLSDRQTVGGWQMGGHLFLKIGEPFSLPLADKNNLMNYRYLRVLTENIMLRIKELVHAANQEAIRIGLSPPPTLPPA